MRSPLLHARRLVLPLVGVLAAGITACGSGVGGDSANQPTASGGGQSAIPDNSAVIAAVKPDQALAAGLPPEVADAVADLGGPIHTEQPAAPPPPTAQPFEPGARQAAPREPEPSAPAEPPRRRSTVREPAPMFSSGAMSDVQPSSAGSTAVW